MTQLTYSHSLVAGTPENVNDVQDMFDDVETLVNGNLDEINLHSTIKTTLGVTDVATVRGGVSIIDTDESRTNTSFGLLTTPDRVSNVEVPPNGVLYIKFYCQMKSSAAGSNAQVALFLGATQLQRASGNGYTPVQISGNSGAAGGDWYHISTDASGLMSDTTGFSSTMAVPPTTGTVLGVSRATPAINAAGTCEVYVAAGTYDVSVQFLGLGVTTTNARRRKLWVATRGY